MISSQPKHLFTLCLFSLVCFFLSGATLPNDPEREPTTLKKIIATSSSPGIPGDTLTFVAVAATSPATMIELDVVATSDKQLVAFPEVNLSKHTDIAELFPNKADADGNYLIPDFSFDVLRKLRRVPTQYAEIKGLSRISSTAIPTFEDCLALITLLEQLEGRDIHLAINIIAPAIHQKKDIDLSKLLLQTLQQAGYGENKERLLLISRDGDELQRIKKELFPLFSFEIPLYQRIGPQPGNEEDSGLPDDQSWMLTRIGSRLLGSYASGVLMHHSLLHDQQGKQLHTSFIEALRSLELPVIAYQISANQENIPEFTENFTTLINYYFDTLKIDGIVTDNVRQAQKIIEEKNNPPQKDHLTPLQQILQQNNINGVSPHTPNTTNFTTTLPKKTMF